eukprot:7357030-Alexandrium_andersonii.AAC.1
MSASLVGSEMCIRDRFQAAPESAETRRKAPEHANYYNMQLVWQGSCASVSYTHLTLPTICSV